LELFLPSVGTHQSRPKKDDFNPVNPNYFYIEYHIFIRKNRCVLRILYGISYILEACFYDRSRMDHARKALTKLDKKLAAARLRLDSIRVICPQ